MFDEKLAFGPHAPTAPVSNDAESHRIAGGTRVRQHVVRRERLRAERLSSSERRLLADRLYDVYRESVHGYSRDEFEAEVFGSGEVSVAQFYGPKGELAGFSHATIERIEHEGRAHAVFCAGVYFRLAYRGGSQSAFFGLTEALRFKLREPRTPLSYLTRSASPAVYRLLVSTMPRAYPSRRHDTPTEILALVRALGTRRRYVTVGDGPWTVRSVATPHDPKRLHRLEHEPDVRFYLQHNPRFADGHALLVWIPLDAANIAGGIVRAAKAHLRG